MIPLVNKADDLAAPLSTPHLQGIYLIPVQGENLEHLGVELLREQRQPGSQRRQGILQNFRGCRGRLHRAEGLNEGV